MSVRLFFKKRKPVIVGPIDLCLPTAKGLWAMRQSGLLQHHLRDWCCWCLVPLH